MFVVISDQSYKTEENEETQGLETGRYHPGIGRLRGITKRRDRFRGIPYFSVSPKDMFLLRQFMMVLVH